MYIATKTKETNTKNKSFKKVRCRCNGKVIIMYLSFSSVLYFALYMQFRPGQECAKSDLSSIKCSYPVHFLAQIQKKQKKLKIFHPKKFLIFSEMELSSSNVKKILIFSQ